MGEYTDGHRDLAQFLFVLTLMLCNQVYCAVEKNLLENMYNNYMKEKCSMFLYKLICR